MFEVGWFFYTNSVIDSALDRAGRLMRTGQVQQTIATPADQFTFLYDEICDVVDFVWRLRIAINIGSANLFNIRGPCRGKRSDGLC